ncbi:Gfo/Idh/MocA family oxidoreductase [Arachidicoccus terrestris]|uniref:Gfo/Idh/MocA family oxidoreductase n=1 Tax=Arachidicoccus terrestris TaxID=2875539 RepID=UPI001CC7B3D2|nr:Gfo/Idh/MocA family oxidoreductase [Arachidicoccus terrestris]UAY53967.1 Gfo/Idh/MocA family oxidoreductase [Arachidicoccus terrestris]
MSNYDRRKFLRNFSMALGGVAAGSLVSEKGLAAGFESLSRKGLIGGPKNYGPNDQINLALIGAGGMGSADTNTALSVPGVKLVAVCDLYDGRLAAAKKKWGNDLFLTKHYKEILNRKDIDAVIVGTPDHWHRQISIDAMAAGKHVYCEKPMVHSVTEGPDVIAAQKKYGKVFQVGSQGMSSLGNEKARALLAAGAIGQLNYAEGFWARRGPVEVWQYPIPEDASAQTVDWDTYISNTTKRPFDKLRFFRWRNYTDYGTGMAGDLFVHLFSSLHFITDSHGPERIYASGGLRYWEDGREVPDVLLGTFDYPAAGDNKGFNLSLRCNFVDGTSGTTYLRLVGSEGAMDVEWDRVTLKRNKTYATDDPFLEAQLARAGKPTDRKKMLPPEIMVYEAEKGYKGAHYDHFNNFFTAIRNDRTVAEDAIFGYRAAAPALLCNDSYFQKKPIEWDPEKMRLRS